MPIANNSFSKGCHEGSVVSIAEFLELEALEWLFAEGDVTAGGGVGGMMDWGCGAGVECLCPKRPPRRPWP
jgi:hypothetical protein